MAAVVSNRVSGSVSSANSNAAKPAADWTQSWSSTCGEMQSRREIQIYGFSYRMIITLNVIWECGSLKRHESDCIVNCVSQGGDPKIVSHYGVYIDVSDTLGYSLSISNNQGQDIKKTSENIRFYNFLWEWLIKNRAVQVD